MKCERNTIEIDYCPSCRGVWLDKGELDKMLEFASKQTSSAQHDQNYTHDSDYDDDKPSYQQGHQKPKRKRSFLGDLFEFD